MMTARVDNNQWIRCGKCGHKLGRIFNPEANFSGIEIKCHSCRELNTLMPESYEMESESPESAQNAI